jgi:hypothetical protein
LSSATLRIDGSAGAACARFRLQEHSPRRRIPNQNYNAYYNLDKADRNS